MLGKRTIVVNVFMTGKSIATDRVGRREPYAGMACFLGNREQPRPDYSLDRARLILVIPAVARGSLPNVVGKGVSANGDQFKAPVGVFSHLYLLN